MHTEEAVKKKSQLRIAAESIAGSKRCSPPLSKAEMESMATNDIMKYIGEHLIGKREGSTEKPVQQDLYMLPEETDHSRFTKTVKEKISKAGSLKDLIDIHTEYPLLKDNMEFLQCLRNRKQEIQSKLEEKV